MVFTRRFATARALFQRTPRDPGVATRAPPTSFVVVTPPVPSWRVGDDHVTCLHWLRKHLRHVPSDAATRGAAFAGAAVFKLFRERRVRVGRAADASGVPERIQGDAKKTLRRASKGRALEPGEFLAVPDETREWRWRAFDEANDADRARGARTPSSTKDARDARLRNELGEALRARTLYEDEHVVVIDKPSGLATVPGANVWTSVDDLRPFLRAECIVHRLDRDTSGALVLARSSFAANRLHAGFREKSNAAYAYRDTDATGARADSVHSGRNGALGAGERRSETETETETETGPAASTRSAYWALVAKFPKRGLEEGWIEAPLGEVDANDGRGERVRVVGAWRVCDRKGNVVSNGFGRSPRTADAKSKLAVTEFKVLARGADAGGPALLELAPVTGRKHQIRVHLAEVLGSPIVGDRKYGCLRERRADVRDRTGGRKPPAPPLRLHAREIRFLHPEGDRRVRVVAPVPRGFKQTLRRFGLDADDA
jgi:23S rRNA-/tRNA-specific pseudouridylate synthase